ncbi:hypothetical protein EROM_092030 [Encephalitozoon romaleae SJ-2008]|uniref:Uncharacterized protein n=1 Tax=Encephalitozoon romaleae (strain SJ-2008) TaxID=1178016 RepID=I7ATM0_ENCRO|nr:hypothetical protein EROM_092030 [Encephalitozoon romaleae SJ-2008]AFN83817.1 hypothetical protein EROM_092030 [Encephalitozoon romaleae SJ-2008]
MINEIKSFLPSPRSLESIEPIKKRAKRKERPSKHVLSKSIYEETDLSKLTPRQRVLHQKYQESKNNVTSFFLLSNNILINSTNHRPKEDKGKMVCNKFTHKGVDEHCYGEHRDDLQKESRFLVVTSDMYNSSYNDTKEESTSSEDGCKVIEAMDVESPFDNKWPEDVRYKDCLICKECFRDAARAYYALEEIGNMHKCGYQNSIMLHKYKIRQNFKKQVCFSVIRKEEIVFIKSLEQLKCCNSNA